MIFFILLTLTAFFRSGVFGVDTDKVTMMKGDSITLQTGVKTILLEDIKWYYNNIRIAQINGDQSYICTDVQCNEETERFRDRLKLDHQTGSLTIMNINTTDSGEYELKIISRSNISEKIFSVTVLDVSDTEQDEMKRKSVKEGESVTLDTGVIKTPNDLMRWYFIDSLIAEITGDQSKICTDVQCNEVTERYRDRLKLDHQTGSLTITNTRTTDSGHYNVKISSNNQTLYKRFTVTVSEPGLSPAAVAGIVLLLLLMALTTAVGVLFYCRKKSELNNQKSKISERRNETSAISGKLKQMSKISTQLMQMTEDCEKELSEISEHRQTLKISEKLKEMSDISERLKQMSKDCEKELSEISERLKHMSLTKKGKNSEQETPLIDNRELFEQEMGTDVTKEDARSEMEKGEREQSIIVEDTTISQAIGGPRDADGRIRDRQGKSLVVRNTESTGKGVNEETSVISE